MIGFILGVFVELGPNAILAFSDTLSLRSSFGPAQLLNEVGCVDENGVFVAVAFQ